MYFRSILPLLLLLLLSSIHSTNPYYEKADKLIQRQKSLSLQLEVYEQLGMPRHHCAELFYKMKNLDPEIEMNFQKGDQWERKLEDLINDGKQLRKSKSDNGIGKKKDKSVLNRIWRRIKSFSNGDKLDEQLKQLKIEEEPKPRVKPILKKSRSKVFGSGVKKSVRFSDPLTEEEYREIDMASEVF